MSLPIFMSLQKRMTQLDRKRRLDNQQINQWKQVLKNIYKRGQSPDQWSGSSSREKKGLRISVTWSNHFSDGTPSWVEHWRRWLFVPWLQQKAPAITLKGIFHAHKNGFGFVSLEGEEEDLFVGRNDVNHAIDGDTVEIVITKVADRNKGNGSRS